MSNNPQSKYKPPYERVILTGAWRTALAPTSTEMYFKIFPTVPVMLERLIITSVSALPGIPFRLSQLKIATVNTIIGPNPIPEPTTLFSPFATYTKLKANWIEPGKGITGLLTLLGPGTPDTWYFVTAIGQTPFEQEQDLAIKAGERKLMGLPTTSIDLADPALPAWSMFIDPTNPIIPQRIAMGFDGVAAAAGVGIRQLKIGSVDFNKTARVDVRMPGSVAGTVDNVLPLMDAQIFSPLAVNTRLRLAPVEPKVGITIDGIGLGVGAGTFDLGGALFGRLAYSKEWPAPRRAA